MKIAYTINGLIGGLSGKNFQLKDQEIAPLIIKYTGNTVNKFIKANNDVDFFIFHHGVISSQLIKSVGTFF